MLSVITFKLFTKLNSPLFLFPFFFTLFHLLHHKPPQPKLNGFISHSPNFSLALSLNSPNSSHLNMFPKPKSPHIPQIPNLPLKNTNHLLPSKSLTSKSFLLLFLPTNLNSSIQNLQQINNLPSHPHMHISFSSLDMILQIIL